MQMRSIKGNLRVLATPPPTPRAMELHKTLFLLTCQIFCDQVFLEIYSIITYSVTVVVTNVRVTIVDMDHS